MGLWETFEYVGELLVLLGVVGEVLSDWPEGKRLAKSSSLVLIIGLAISLAALRRTNEQFNGTIASLNLKASQANERAAKDEATLASTKAGTISLGIDLEHAKTETGEAVQRAAEANKVAEQERIERLKLEERIAPRRIDLRQLNALRLTCASSSPFRRVAVITYPLDTEATVLASQILNGLNCGRRDFAVDNKLATVMPMGSFVFGIQVTGSDKALVDSLRGIYLHS